MATRALFGSSNTTVVLPRVASGNHLSPVGSPREASTSTETTRRIENSRAVMEAAHGRDGRH